MREERFNLLECLLFVAGDPVAIVEIARVLDCPVQEAKALLADMETAYREAKRGIQLLVTGETAQLVSNRDYYPAVEALLQPEEKRSVSQSLMETLSVIAYRQPVTRAEIEQVRGVRCDYAVNQLTHMGLIGEAGRRDLPGRPILFATTDKFLRQFGLHSVEELPEYLRYKEPIAEEEAGEGNIEV